MNIFHRKRMLRLTNDLDVDVFIKINKKKEKDCKIVE